MPQTNTNTNAISRKATLLALASTMLCILAALAATAARATNPVLEILPAASKFTFESKAGEKIKRRTLGGKEVSCEKVTGSGEFTSKRLGTVEFDFVNCEALGFKCTGLEAGETTGLLKFKAEFHIRHLLATGNGVSIMVLVGHIHFSCSIILFLELGSICSDDILTKASGEPAENKLLSEMFVSFLDSGTLEKPSGDPKVTEVDTDNSLGMEKCELLMKEGTGGSYETTSLLLSGTIKALAGKTLLVDLSGAHE